MSVENVTVTPGKHPLIVNVTVIEGTGAEAKRYSFPWNTNVKLTKTGIKAALQRAKDKAAPDPAHATLAAEMKTKLST